MSKGRELLKRVRDTLHELEETHYDLYWDIQAELDLDEQVPVAWIYEWAVRSSFDGSFTGEWKEEFSRIKPDGTVEGFNPTKLESTVRNLVPLYTAPPKREPLSEDEIFNIGYSVGFTLDHVKNDDGSVYGFLNEYGYIDNNPYFKFVRAIEKEHGIGVENEN
jgi:hypothetical protein